VPHWILDGEWRKDMNRIICSVAVLACCSCDALAQNQANQGGGADAESVAKQLANPVADLVSVPLQFNWDQGVGPNDELRTIINLQPVVPLSLSDDWNLIGRMILPFVNQPSLAPGVSPTSGTGDMLLSGFFSPAQPRGAIWGVGPAVSLPMTTDPFLGSGKWSAGPTAVALKQSGQWTYGALVNHLWSFADASDIDRADVNQSFLQPFLAYTTKTASTFTVQSEASANWEAASGEEWTVPINVSISKVTRLGPFPFSFAVGGGYFVERPSGGPEWKLRFTATLILPRAR
jgi:hypothetical protein